MQRSLLLQHQRAFAADRRDELFRDLGEQPRQRDLDADAVVQHVDQARGVLAERRGAEGQPVAVPGLLGDVEQTAELAAGALEARISGGAPPPRGRGGGERTQRRAGTWDVISGSLRIWGGASAMKRKPHRDGGALPLPVCGERVGERGNSERELYREPHERPPKAAYA